MKDNNMKERAIIDYINQLEVDIKVYNDAIINDYGKTPVSEEVKDFYRSEIKERENSIELLKKELEKIGGIK
ncbi:hypothetical protein UFOVP1119_86 [uncultured Caudovirales phage]|uniref:Uncharacterized protein n=1 Tax=uncultured Caudovirales phage TaxID=2100421 RepID=A0A6J5RBZ5_9CAUD|nr:hypothetical protein UFOVP1119_86 [uncultured Caudovirales phage]CAB4193362.1 hypothetical protein UFOVP1238_60 [uncultured Caudovirales phage]